MRQRQGSPIERPVVTRDDAVKGVVPIAFVVPRAGFTDSEELRASLTRAVVEAVGATAKPADVYFVSTVPRTRRVSVRGR